MCLIFLLYALKSAAKSAGSFKIFGSNSYFNLTSQSAAIYLSGRQTKREITM